MANQYRNDSPDAIKADIERTRAEMGAKIDRIGDRLSPEQLKAQAQESMSEMMTDTANQIKHYVQDHQRELSDNLVHTLKHNPVPTALIGIGLGWLLVESFSSSSSDEYDYRDYTRGEGYYDDMYARRRRAQYAGLGYDYDYRTGDYRRNYDPRYGTSYGRGPVQPIDENGYPYDERAYEDWYGREAFDASSGNYDNGRSMGDEARDRARGMRDRAQGMADEMGQQANEAKERAKGTAQHMGDQIRHGAEEARDRTRQTMEEGRSRMEEMGYEARHRSAEVGRQMRHQAAQAGREARHQAAQAGREARHQAARAGRKFERTLEDNPLTFGFLAFGAGMVLSMLMPQTRMENKTIGPVSDQVKESGYEMAQDAARRAQRVAEDVRPDLEETARKVRDDLTDTAREAKEDVKGTMEKAKEDAKSEAEGSKAKAQEEAEKVKGKAQEQANASQHQSSSQKS